MKDFDDAIKQTLQSKIQRIDDDSFTKRIVDIHLVNKQAVEYKPFANFLSIVIGLSSLIISLGLVYVLKQNYDWLNGIDINVDDGLILVLISIMFLAFKLADEISGKFYKSLARQ